MNLAVPPEPNASDLPTRLRVHVAADVLSAMEEYARMDTSRERGGILFGHYYNGVEGGITEVSGWHQAEYTESTGASVTFTHETWAHVHSVRERDFPDDRIMGWFHTHPNFGVFLSNYDVFLHRTLFEFPGATALVIDPVRNERGVFHALPGDEMGQCELLVTEQVNHIGAPARPSPVRYGKPGVIALLFAIMLVFVVTSTWRIAVMPGRVEVDRLTSQVQTLTAEREQLIAALKQRASPPQTIPPTPAQVRQVTLMVVRAGDSLSQISLDVYGTAHEWPQLARANGLAEPWALVPGQRLKVPDAPVSQGAP